MIFQKILGAMLLCTTMVVSGCAGFDAALQRDAKHVEITNSGFVLPLSPDPAGAALVLGTQRINIDSVPVFTETEMEKITETVTALDGTSTVTVTETGVLATQFQSLYEEYDSVTGRITRKVIDTISFCNDTNLNAGTPGTGGDSSTVARTSSGNAATDRCQQPSPE
jgi:hypothetical protein